VINWTFTDVGEKFALNLENSALTNVPGKLAAEADADAEFTLTRATLNSVLVRQTTFANAIRSGDITADGTLSLPRDRVGGSDAQEDERCCSKFERHADPSWSGITAC
jgi:alkyl sulfatase BDS1-like metallo-beta-lactamase superfamily hydrolase